MRYKSISFQVFVKFQKCSIPPIEFSLNQVVNDRAKAALAADETNLALDKTRLALEAAIVQQGEYQRIAFVSLADLTTKDDLAAAIRDVLDEE